MRRDREVRETRMPLARGGVSFGAIITGVVVALGAFVLLSAIAAGILVATGASAQDVSGGNLEEVGIAGGIVLALAWFLAYLWGGYTAGRMARGAGLLNGLLVPVVAILLLLIAGGIAAALGADDLNLQNPLPISTSNAADYGIPIGIATLVAIFLGAIVGGMLGSNWHNKLERRTVEDRVTDDERRDAEIRGRAAAERERADAERERLEARDDRDQRRVVTTTDQPVVTRTDEPVGSRSDEPVVTRHETVEERPAEKPTLKDRLTGQ
jgi:hypothetical protein